MAEHDARTIPEAQETGPWWHVYYGWMPDTFSFCMTIIGDSTKPPADVEAEHPRLKNGLRYITSWDMEPDGDDASDWLLQTLYEKWASQGTELAALRDIVNADPQKLKREWAETQQRRADEAEAERDRLRTLIEQHLDEPQAVTHAELRRSIDTTQGEES